MQNATAPTLGGFSAPHSGDELLSQPTTYQGNPASELLTSQEAASGCQLFEVPNDNLSPALLPGDYVVAQPLPEAQWATLAPDNYCLILRQYEAASDGSWPAFQGHSLGRVVGNGLRYGGELLALYDDDHDGHPFPVGVSAEELVKVYRITRSIRPL